ncbi:MAG TPA: TIGR03013 family PEP-CTERM/XrtA system glycosyltransferase [Gammaproteobacteria bacterium]|nr:TIGR03013 family PEP-CTERM/XrtA system glycosyltransferase [Gammaproteobacteria bacterium]
MLRIFRHYIPTTLLLLGLAEALILVVSIYVGAVLGIAFEGIALGGNGTVLMQAVVFCAAMLAGMIAMGFYQRDQRDGPIETVIRLSLSFVVGFLVMGAIYVVEPQLVLGGASTFVALIASFIGIATCRIVCSAKTDARFSRRVLVLGVGDRAKQIEKLRRASDRLGITLVGFIDIGIDRQVVSEAKIIRPNVSLRTLAERFAAEELVVAIDDRRKGLPVDDILECKMHGIRILDESTFLERQLGKIRLDALHPSGVIFADGFTQAVIRRTEKRLFDIVASLFLLSLTLPFMLLAALAILLESGRPIFYTQRRVGLRGECFNVIKFRSMRTDAEVDGKPVWAAKEDSRVTRVGKFIRKTRIDELPQLLNVLKGDMSFVGPRPERPEFVSELAQAIPYYDLRHHVKPGITGWAQVSYPYGSSIKDAREKLQYDLYYLKNYSVFLDVNILLQTIQVILWGKGAR